MWLIGAALGLTIVFGATTASAGFVQEYVKLNGGCESSPEIMHQLEPPMDISRRAFLGRRGQDWSDDDVAEYRRILTECTTRWPEMYGTSRSTRADVARQVDRRVSEVEEGIHRARRRIREAENEQREKEDEAQQAARERREAMLSRARQDRETAERAAKLADEEAPLIEEAEREAAEARKVRHAAEARLAAVRDQVGVAQQQRQRDDNATSAARAQEIETENRQREAEADAALAKTCAISAAQYERAAMGMSVPQVRRVFGCVGSLTSETAVAGIGKFAVHQWTGRSGAAVTTFNNGRLVAKSQTDLD